MTPGARIDAVIAQLVAMIAELRRQREESRAVDARGWWMTQDAERGEG